MKLFPLPRTEHTGPETLDSAEVLVVSAAQFDVEIERRREDQENGRDRPLRRSCCPFAGRPRSGGVRQSREVRQEPSRPSSFSNGTSASNQAFPWTTGASRPS